MDSYILYEVIHINEWGVHNIYTLYNLRLKSVCVCVGGGGKWVGDEYYLNETLISDKRTSKPFLTDYISAKVDTKSNCMSFNSFYLLHSRVFCHFFFSFLCSLPFFTLTSTEFCIFHQF